MKLAIFDLDGCVADDRRRRGRIPLNATVAEDWTAYHTGCGGDPVANAEMVRSHEALGHRILFITSRPERYREETERWILDRLRPAHWQLLMRPDGDATGSADLKPALFRAAGLCWDDVVAAYDDREDVLAAYEREGAGGVRRLSVIAPGPAEALERMAETFRERSAVYGPTYERFGAVAAALWPEGLGAASEEEWARRGVLLQIVHKLLRYIDTPNGHVDSAHDLGTYGAILESITQQKEHNR